MLFAKTTTSGVCSTRFSNWTHTCLHTHREKEIRRQRYIYRQSMREWGSGRGREKERSSTVAIWCSRAFNRCVVTSTRPARKSFQVNNKWSIIIRHQTRWANRRRLSFGYGQRACLFVCIACEALLKVISFSLSLSLFYVYSFQFAARAWSCNELLQLCAQIN